MARPYLDLDPYVRDFAAQLLTGAASESERFMVRTNGARRCCRTDSNGNKVWADVPDGAVVIEVTDYVKEAAQK